MHRKTAALKHDFVLAAHQMGIDQRQPAVLGTLQHRSLAFGTFTPVVRRGVDHYEQLSPQCLAVLGGAWAPGIFANQHADFDRLALGIGHLNHTRPIPRFEIALFVKNLVVGQLSLDIGVQHMARPYHAGGIKTWCIRYAARRLKHIAMVSLCKSGVTHKQS